MPCARTVTGASSWSRGCTSSRTRTALAHFNVLRGHLSAPGVSGVKVVGDFVPNYAVGLPSELGLLTLYDPGTGVPLSIMDATMITARRTGAMTAVGARHLARPDSRVLGHVGARGTAFWNAVLAGRDVRSGRDPGHQPRYPSPARRSRGQLAAVCRAASGSPPPPGKPSTAPTSWSRRRGSPSRSRCSAPAVVKPGAFVVPTARSAPWSFDLLDVMDKVVVDDWREAQSGRFGALRRHVDSGLALGRVALRRAGTDRHRAACPAGNGPMSGSCSGIAGWPSSTSPLASRSSRRAEQLGRRDDAPVPLAMPAAHDHRSRLPDLGLIRAVAAYQAVSRRARPAAMRCSGAATRPRRALRDGRPVYGVNTGMGALSAVRLTERSSFSNT